jgi:hypothetical protein
VSGPGRPRATGPCARCGADEWKLRRKVGRNHKGEPYETMSRACVPCARRLRREARARARTREAVTLTA